MKEGSFALIDCLGWKGIWKRTSEAALIKKLDRIEHAVRAEVDKFNSDHRETTAGSINAQIRLISDTVAVSLQYLDDEPLIDDINRGYLVWAACPAIVRIQGLFLAKEPRIVLRGCITYGDHIVVNNFIIGPAVDEAAEHYEIAEGAFVWLLPSAVVHYESAKLFLGHGHALLIPYDMPLKAGARLRSLVLNPLYLEDSSDQRQTTIRPSVRR